MGRQSTRDRGFGRFRLPVHSWPCLARFHTRNLPRSRNPPIPAHSMALTAFRSTTYTCKNWKGLQIRLYDRHQLWRANLTWELVIQKGRKEGGEGWGDLESCVNRKAIKNNNPNLIEGEKYQTLHNRKAHERCLSAGHITL
jgi:hypothetical protein